MLTGNEYWIKQAKEGEIVWANSGLGWWPIVHIELDCELIKIDVCNMIEILSLDDCEIRIGDTDIVEDVYLETKGKQNGQYIPPKRLYVRCMR